MPVTSSSAPLPFPSRPLRELYARLERARDWPTITKLCRRIDREERRLRHATREGDASADFAQSVRRREN